MRPAASGGGWKAVRYTLRMANQAGWLPLWRAMRSRNACKTCALGMGGQMGGMVNEAGHFPEVCKKSLQAMVADMRAGISADFFARYSIAELRTLSARELESCGRLVDPLYAAPGATHYRVVGWDEALDRIAARLKASGPGRSFFYASGRSSNEAGFLLQLFARACAVPRERSAGNWSGPTTSVRATPAMYYPEANVLVPRTVDPRSKTPAFKSVLVEILPEPG